MPEDAKQPSDEQRQLPPVTFIGHVNELAITAQAYLGGMRDPETQEPVINLALAKRAIDTLEMLQEKTRGNLEAPERNFLENILYDLRMTYVRVASQPREKPSQGSEETPGDESPTRSPEEGKAPRDEEAPKDAKESQEETPQEETPE